MWHPAKLALGAAITACFVAYYVALETSCADMSQRGELVMTSGGTAEGTQTGVRLFAPPYAWSGEIPLNGTADARLLWIENVCDDVLDCSLCPPQLRRSAAFNASVLVDAWLICDPWIDVRLTICGFNRMARVLARTGLAGIAHGRETGNPLDTPGRTRNIYRLGEHRDTGGIPFPFVSIGQYAFNPILEALANGVHMRAMLTPTAPNPWQSTMCGYWKPLQTILMLGHVWVMERAASCFIGHVKSAGVRFDLAQAASVSEVMAHLLSALSFHDPFLEFHWGLMPYVEQPCDEKHHSLIFPSCTPTHRSGTYIAAVMCPLVLTCSSTLLLAGFWYVVSRKCCVQRCEHLIITAAMHQVPNDRSRRVCICGV